MRHERHCPKAKTLTRARLPEAAQAQAEEGAGQVIRASCHNPRE